MFESELIGVKEGEKHFEKEKNILFLNVYEHIIETKKLKITFRIGKIPFLFFFLHNKFYYLKKITLIYEYKKILFLKLILQENF